MSHHPRCGGRLRASVLGAALAACLLAPPALAQSDGAPLGADLASLLDYARRHNPALASAQGDAEAAAQRIGPAGALPDPVLRVELENFSNTGNPRSASLLPGRVGETKYTLMQQLPAWGKRDLRRDVATADARQVLAQAAGTWAEQAMQLRTAFAQYFLAARTERITSELLDLVARLEQVAQSRYAGGLVPQADAIRAQLEQTALRSELIALAGEKRRLAARINALLGREATAALAEPRELPALPASERLRLAELLRRARATNPTLQAEAARIESARAGSELVRRNRYPDFNVGLSPTQMGSRVSSWSLMLEMNIPLQQGTRRAQEAEAAAMLQAARDRARAAADQAAAGLEEQLAGLQAARRTEELLRQQLLPQSELVLQSALGGYENGRSDFTTLLQAQRDIRKARLDLLKARVEAQARLAEIERTLGEPL